MIETPQQLRRAIAKLPVNAPITERFEGDLRGEGVVWYRHQKQHWLGWLKGYDGPGAYGRLRWDRSARFVYNHVVCPPMLLWLAEAAGLPPPGLLAAARDAAQTGGYLAARCKVLRAHLPWETVEMALSGRKA